MSTEKFELFISEYENLDNLIKFLDIKKEELRNKIASIMHNEKLNTNIIPGPNIETRKAHLKKIIDILTYEFKETSDLVQGPIKDWKIDFLSTDRKTINHHKLLNIVGKTVYDEIVTINTSTYMKITKTSKKEKKPELTNIAPVNEDNKNNKLNVPSGNLV